MKLGKNTFPLPLALLALHTCTVRNQIDSNLIEWCVLRMMMGQDRVVWCSVISYEEGPPSPVTIILVTTMEDVTVEEKCITWFQLHINKRTFLHQHLYSFHIGTSLFPHFYVIDSSCLVRTFQHLHIQKNSGVTMWAQLPKTQPVPAVIHKFHLSFTVITLLFWPNKADNFYNTLRTKCGTTLVIALYTTCILQ